MSDFLSYVRDPGPKETVIGQSAVCSTDNAIVTETVLGVLRAGGNAADAAVAGCMVQAVVEPFMTNHAGTVSLLYRDGATGSFHQLHSAGTFPPHLAPFKPVPKMPTGLGSLPPSACIPGFMPGLKAIHERFATLPWKTLCQDAVTWAETGHPVSSFEYGANLGELDLTTYFPEGRRFTMPDGRLPPVGTLFRNNDMAMTMRRVAEEGPDYMISGGWAQRFLETARAMGWPICIQDMNANPPRWIEPTRFRHGQFEIVSLSAPEQQGAFLAMVLGILGHLGIGNIAPGTADHLYAMGHALRTALYFCGFLGDPSIGHYDIEQLHDCDFHRALARLISGMRPKCSLANHVRLTRGSLQRSDGHGLAGIPSSEVQSRQPSGSCELSIVDSQGNWLQLMNTLQSGGIPGMVVDGIPMVGSHATFSGVSGHFDAKLIAGSRLRSIAGHSFILKDGLPLYGLGTPGNVYCTVPQILTNLLDFAMPPDEAIDAPRVLPLGEDYGLVAEDRIAAETITGLADLGIGLSVLPAYDWHMGSFQMCFRDQTGHLGAVADPRRCGMAGGLP